MMKIIFKFLKRKKESGTTVERSALEKKAVKGAEKAVKEYRRVFERLAEYDRT